MNPYASPQRGACTYFCCAWQHRMYEACGLHASVMVNQLLKPFDSSTKAPIERPFRILSREPLPSGLGEKGSQPWFLVLPGDHLCYR